GQAAPGGLELGAQRLDPGRRLRDRLVDRRQPALDVLPLRVERGRLAPELLGRAPQLRARVPHRQLAGLLLLLLGRLHVRLLLALDLLALLAQRAALGLELLEVLFRLDQRALGLAQLVLALLLEIGEAL